MHISVCICTYCRPLLLSRLLNKLVKQDGKHLLTFSIVVTDNDAQQSAKNVVEEFAANYNTLDITYCVEPRRSIAFARNLCLEKAKGERIAFIDDDEFPLQDWLFNLNKAMDDFKASAIFGPVKPHFDNNPPSWLIKSQLCERAEHQTGSIVPSNERRTGNVLIDRHVFKGMETIFRPQFATGSEDTDLFNRLDERGCKFIWCNEAVVFEVVPPNRWKRSYYIKRALLRGSSSLLRIKKKWFSIIKSFVAIPTYCVLLLFIHIWGHHFFMKFLIKLCDHIGKVFALIGFFPIKEREM